MNPELVSLNTAQQGVLRRLRPPCARALRVVFPFQHAPANYGLTLQVPQGEPVVSPGNGRITLVRSTSASWQFTKPSVHEFASTYAVLIDHGQNIKTLLHGLESIDVNFGQSVTRGTRLGLAAGSEIFFGIQAQNNFFDPSTVNRHFVPKDEQLVSGQGGFLKQAPDLLLRAAGNFISTIYSSIRYIWDRTLPPILINIDFNGSGLKHGAAAVGITPTDYWNIAEPADFIISQTGYYNCFGSTFNIPPLRFLKDYTGKDTMVQFERIVATNHFGTSPSFDPMLATWIGGYSGASPYTNFFAIRGLPTGAYKFRLYANDGTIPLVSNFYVALDNDIPTLKTNNPTLAPAFVQDQNYVTFIVLVPYRSVVNIKSYGFVSGLQISRQLEESGASSPATGSSGLPKLTAPRFSPPSGSNIVTFPLNVVISSPESGRIRYTLDGSTPNITSPVYTGPVSITDVSVVVRAYASKTDFDDSDVATATYIQSTIVTNFTYGGEVNSPDFMGPYASYFPNGHPDFRWDVTITLAAPKELVRIEIYQTDASGAWNSGQVWSTDSPIHPAATLPWPGHSPPEAFGCFGLAIFEGGIQNNFAPLATQGNYAPGIHSLSLYGEKDVTAHGFFRIFLFFGDGTVATATIPAS
jgi:hypothetical protein